MSNPDNAAPEIVNALKAGFAAPTYVGRDELAAASQGDPKVYARLLGQCLGERAEMVWSASVSEYRRDAAAYDKVAAEINARFGQGLAILSSEGGAMGIRS